MSNSYAAWYLRVQLPDMEQVMAPPPVEREAGDGLPADFPRDEFTDDQLVLLDEYYHSKKEQVLRVFYELLRVHPESHDLELRQLIMNAGILAKILGIGDYRSYSYAELARRLGTSEASLYRHKRAIMLRLAAIQDVH